MTADRHTTNMPISRRAAVLLACLLFALAAVRMHAQSRALGSIQGRVVDLNLDPVPGATVYAVSGPAGTGRAHGVTTDQDGRFLLEQLVPGTYTLSAFKLADGYGDMADPFYAQPDHPLSTVTVSTATEASDLSIQLGVRGGILHIEVNDAVTQRPITSAALVLQNLSTGGKLEGERSFPDDFLVPAGDISIAIHETGYLAWHYSSQGHDYMLMHPGDHRDVHADLQPTSSSKPQ